MVKELQALEKSHTWDLVDIPPGKTAIGCKWIYKIKNKLDTFVERYKARLITKGFAQEYRIDYKETFAPVIRMTSVRCLLAVVVVQKLTLFRMDVKNIYFNGDLYEEFYMKPPSGYSHTPHKVCKLLMPYIVLKKLLVLGLLSLAA